MNYNFLPVPNFAISSNLPKRTYISKTQGVESTYTWEFRGEFIEILLPGCSDLLKDVIENQPFENVKIRNSFSENAIKGKRHAIYIFFREEKALVQAYGEANLRKDPLDRLGVEARINANQTVLLFAAGQGIINPKRSGIVLDND